MGKLSFWGSYPPTPEAGPHAHPIEGGEVGSGSQHVKQLPIAHADSITHKTDPTTASHICRKGRSVAQWVGEKGTEQEVGHGGVHTPCTR